MLLREIPNPLKKMRFWVAFETRIQYSFSWLEKYFIDFLIRRYSFGNAKRHIADNSGFDLF
jgi:hypothetical protein